MDQLRVQLRDLYALASEGILDAAEYAQLKADAIAAHRQLHADTAAAQRVILAESTNLGDALPTRIACRQHVE